MIHATLKTGSKLGNKPTLSPSWGRGSELSPVPKPYITDSQSSPSWGRGEGMELNTTRIRRYG